uniref:Unannotated protein n=1 Tax=freshwater metagenome TaxID=449393 RepID=A0A6J5ZWV3_9ZZZZ
MLDNRPQPPGRAIRIEPGGMADEYLKPPLICVLGIVGAEAVPPRQPKQARGVALDDADDESVQILSGRRVARIGHVLGQLVHTYCPLEHASGLTFPHFGAKTAQLAAKAACSGLAGRSRRRLRRAQREQEREV